MIAFYSAYGRANSSTLQATSNVVRFYTGIQVSLFNGVLSAQLKTDGVEATFDSLQAKIDEQGAPALWWVGPQSKPDNLKLLLEHFGLHPAWELPGMAIDLVLVDSKLESISNFTIQEVRNAEMQALWARIAAVGTGFPDAATDALARLEAVLADPQYKAQHDCLGAHDAVSVG
jgi:hypothetical protein